jgi:hypothetical protein
MHDNSQVLVLRHTLPAAVVVMARAPNVLALAEVSHNATNTCHSNVVGPRGFLFGPPQQLPLGHDEPTDWFRNVLIASAHPAEVTPAEAELVARNTISVAENHRDCRPIEFTWFLKKTWSQTPRSTIFTTLLIK